MIERNAGLPPERRIEFRVGIHLGDVVEESDGDLMATASTLPRALKALLIRAVSVFPRTPTAKCVIALRKASPISERKNSKTSLGQCECSRSRLPRQV